MTIVTKAKYARLHGMGRQAAQNWGNDGHLALTVDGLVDVEKSDLLLEGAKRGRFSDEIGAVPRQDQSIEEFLTGLAEGKSGTKAAAGQVKESALAGLRALEFQRVAGSLIELTVAETTFFEVSRSFRDALMVWPSHAGPLIAADLDLPAEKVVETLGTHVRAFLAGLGNPEFKT